MAGLGRENLRRIYLTGEFRTHANAKIGFFGVTPVVRPSAYTQTANSTASKTQIAAAATTAATNTSPFGYSTQAQADAVRAAANRALELCNAIIDDLQALGLVA